MVVRNLQPRKKTVLSAFSEDTHRSIVRSLSRALGCRDGDVPAAFLSLEPRPLKIGIFNDLTARYPHADASKLGRFMASYTRSRPYQTAVKTTVMRIDLDGNEVEQISEEERRRADKIMNFVDRKVNERRLKRRQARSQLCKSSRSGR